MTAPDKTPGVALLDTQALLWFLEGSPRLSEPALATITEPGVELFVSYASAWEITIKHGNGKLALPAPPEAFLLDQLTLNRIRLLPISIGSIFHTGQLPAHHKDPFDRRRLRSIRRPPTLVISVPN